MTWFRVNNDICHDPKLFNCDVNAKWLWICLLSFAAKETRAQISYPLSYITQYSGLKNEMTSRNALKSLAEHGLVQIRNESDRDRDQNLNLPIENVSNEQNEQDKTNETNEHVTNSCAFVTAEACQKIYASYPRKEGKKKGMEKLLKIVTDRDMAVRVWQALQNYLKLCRDEGRDKTTIKKFETWVNNWTDYESEDVFEDNFTDNTIDAWVKQGDEDDHANAISIRNAN